MNPVNKKHIISRVIFSIAFTLLTIALHILKNDKYNVSDYVVGVIPYFFFLMVLDVFVMLLLNKENLVKIFCNICLLLLFTIIGVNL